MADDRLFPEYRDEHAGTSYPFVDGAPLISADGAVALLGAVLDAAVYPIGGGPGLGVTAAEGGDTARVWVGTAAAPRLCAAAFDPLRPPASLPLRDAYDRPAGVLICDPLALATAQAWPPGAHPFAPAAEFVASCTVAVPGGPLRGLLVGGRLVAGDVWLVGDGGVVLGLDGGAIRIDVVGDPLGARRQCGPGGRFQAPRFVRTINGGPPDAHGNFAITAGDGGVDDTILRIAPLDEGAVRIAAAGRGIGT